jgi:xanthine/uracil permease
MTPEVLDRLYVLACWGDLDRPTCVEAPSLIVAFVVLLIVALVARAFRGLFR